MDVVPDVTSGAAAEPPRVSVVTIFRDAERFLSDAVESVLAQTLTDWELLLVDDGSSDTSADMARAYAHDHVERVRYLEHPDRAHRGISASRNLGLAHARGSLITFVDADDVIAPAKLEEQVRLLGATPAARFLCAPAQWWYSW